MPRLSKFDVNPIADATNDSIYRLCLITKYRLDRNGLTVTRAIHPRENRIIEIQLRYTRLSCRSKNDLPSVGMDFLDVHSFSKGNAETASLANRIPMNPLMPTKDSSGLVNEITLRKVAKARLEKLRVIAVGDKADIAAFLLLSG
jgi:hypothetical protein